jgi:VIT1/CCC1 family predicted Fe2+/Mn2+ transporter
MVLRIVFVIAGIVGIVAVFYVSWFWRALIIPMIIILLADGLVSLWSKLKR